MYFWPVLVVPVRDGGLGLERISHDLRFDDGLGALDQRTVNVGKQSGLVLEAVVAPAHALEVEHGLHFPMVPLQGFVVVIRGQRAAPEIPVPYERPNPSANRPRVRRNKSRRDDTW